MAYAGGFMRRVLLRASAKVAVSALGGALVALGIGLLFLPGPGILVLVAGLAVLAREFLWAQQLRDRLNARVDALRRRARRRHVEPRSHSTPGQPQGISGGDRRRGGGPR